MARRNHDNMSNDDGVQDSFLDIVANIVGILILLVIVVGVRAASQPSLPSSAKQVESIPLHTSAMLEAGRQEVIRIEHAVNDAKGALILVRREADEREQEREGLATYTAAVSQQLDQQKASLSKANAERLAVRSALAKADFEWQNLMLQKVAIGSDAGAPRAIVHTPTPIVRNHSDKTLHLRLDQGRVAVVPFEKLLKLLDGRSAASHRRDLQRQGGVGIVGPTDGFELHYALITRASPPGPQGNRQLVTFVAGEIRPAVEQLGKEIEAALTPGSTLSNALAGNQPADTIVMVWTYPNSTSAFRDLQKELRQRGYSVDLRLLPEDGHISFSPEGRKTAAQ